jgi:hypothetical protein
MFFNHYNNAVLNSIKAMPAKDITSDGTADFSNARHTYYETQSSTPETNEILLKKKWFSNRDASQVVANRRVSNIGYGTMNAANGPTSFMTKPDNSTRIRAYNRVRNGGYCVPPKVRGQPYSSQLYQF